jgi:hypothetical protein
VKHGKKKGQFSIDSSPRSELRSLALFQVTATLHAAGMPSVDDFGFIGGTGRLERVRDVLVWDGLEPLCHDY